ncbi:MAG: fibronectin type III domain-containing protein, partial [Phycisphaerae bacterium]
MNEMPGIGGRTGRAFGGWVALALAALTCAPQAAAAPGAGGEFQGVWTHAGPHSAVVCWRMKDLADEATSYVEYGPTSEYGQKTPPTTEPRWAHFHRLTGLKPGSKGHYRPVLVRDGKTVAGPAAA